MSTSKSSEKKSASSGPMAALIDMQRAGLGSLKWMEPTWVEALGEMSTEISQFVADRIKTDVKTQHAILHCKDPGELQSIQADFIKKAIEDYSAETGKLMEMSAKLFSPKPSGS